MTCQLLQLGLQRLVWRLIGLLQTESETEIKCLCVWGGGQNVNIYRLNAQLHSLSVEFNGFIIISFLVFLKGLSDEEVGAFEVQLLPGLERVALLGLDC